MKFSLNADSPREAGYAVSMFQALQTAMIADPPPVAQFSQSRVGDVSHTVLTGYQDLPTCGLPVTGTAAAESDQEDDTANDTGNGAATAGTADKPKRGRKSAEQKAQEALARAPGEEHALKPGAALQGVNAQSLAAALDGMPLVHEEGGVQVRTALDTPPDEIAAMRERLKAQEEKIQAEEAAAAVAKAAKDAAAVPAATTPLAVVVELPKPPSPPADDDLLASLFAKKATPVVEQPGVSNSPTSTDRSCRRR
jgi:hypothetical protein